MKRLTHFNTAWIFFSKFSYNLLSSLQEQFSRIFKAFPLIFLVLVFKDTQHTVPTYTNFSLFQNHFAGAHVCACQTMLSLDSATEMRGENVFSYRLLVTKYLKILFKKGSLQSCLLSVNTAVVNPLS